MGKNKMFDWYSLFDLFHIVFALWLLYEIVTGVMSILCWQYFHCGFYQWFR